LSQRKAETITYLPVIPVRVYFSTIGFLPETYRKIRNNLKAGRFSLDLPWSADSFVPPKLHQVEVSIKAIRDHLSDKQRGTAETLALNRAIKGLQMAAAISSSKLSEVSAEDLSVFFGSEWPKMKERIVTNSFSSHIHFVPSDDQDPMYAGIATPSVVLFRYPFTTSIELFDLAQNTTTSSWADAVTHATGYLPAAEMFAVHVLLRFSRCDPTFCTIFFHGMWQSTTALVLRISPRTLSAPSATKWTTHEVRRNTSANLRLAARPSDGSVRPS
jgi:hypothetical protein